MEPPLSVGFSGGGRPLGFTPRCEPDAAGARSWEHGLQRLFSTFPGGWPAIGLLLLRAAVGGAAVVRGSAYLTGIDPVLERWLIGVPAIASGASLLLGFLSPVAGAAIALGATATASRWMPPPSQMVLDQPIVPVLVAVVALAIVLLGPGAWSLDAWLFGRREIIIPPDSRSARS